MKKIKTYILAHKIISTIGAIVIIFIGYKVYAAYHTSVAQTTYVLGTVTQGTIDTTVTGSGQVSTTNSIDLSPKSSGAVIYLNAVVGQQVKAGQLIAEVDPTTQEQTIQNAKNSLESAQLSIEKSNEAPTAVTMLQAQNAVTQAQENFQTDTNDLTQDYNTGFTSVANAFTQLPTIMSGLTNILYSYSNSVAGGNEQIVDYFTNQASQYDVAIGTATGLENDLTTKYQAALAAYNANFQDYRNADRTEATSSIASLIKETYLTTENLSDATKSVTDLIQYYEDRVTAHSQTPIALANTDLTTLNTYTSQINSNLTSLFNATNSLLTDQQAINNAQISIASSQASLAALIAGPDPLDLQSQQLSIEQQQNALAQDETDLQNYYVYAPFDGTIAKVDVMKGDTAGGGTAVATEITNQQIATLSLNEIDAAKVSVGQAATLTFDAVPGLSIAGVVSEIDTQGTVSQGVVTYDVQIAFATQDTRVKPGMTVDASIVTAADENVLVVPNTAVKTVGGASYVQVFDPLPAGVNASSTTATTVGIVSATPPQSVAVQVGLANNTQTEITGGLTAGQTIVVRTGTIGGTAKTTTTATPAATGATRAGGFGGGAGATGGAGILRAL